MILTNIFKTILRTSYVLGKMKWSTLFKKHSSKSKQKVILFPNFYSDIFRYFYSDAFANDMALLAAVSSKYPDFHLIVGARNMNRIYDNNVFINLSNRLNFQKFRNYSSALVNFIKELEDQNNIVHPSSKEALYWENKVYMHTKFSELSIKSPYTEFWNLDDLNRNLEEKAYPFLIKEIHSAGSNGVHKITDKKKLIDITSNRIIRMGNKFVLAQNLLEMDRDLRVIIIGREIVLFYWRINQGKDWKPTSTKHGSKVDFVNFPEHWRDHIINEFLKLEITSGAFDLVWENNDMTKPPYVLEVSPSFQPNPMPPDNLKTSYGQYKAGVSINGWDKRFVSILFELKMKLIDSYSDQSKHLSNSN